MTSRRHISHPVLRHARGQGSDPSTLQQDYLCQQLLGWDTAGQAHDAAFDATKSMRLYHLYHHLQQDPAAWQRAQVPTHPCWLHQCRCLS